MPESIPAPLVIDTLRDTFREGRGAVVAEGWPAPRHPWLGWILSVPDTHQKTVLAALDKEEAIRVLTCATEDEATAVAAGLWIGGDPPPPLIYTRPPASPATRWSGTASPCSTPSASRTRGSRGRTTST